MTTLAKVGRVTDQVRTEARELDPVKALATLGMVVPFALGFLAAFIASACWTVLAWTWQSVVVGWRTARGTARGEDAS